MSIKKNLVNLTSQQKQRIQELKQLLGEYKKILGLEKEKIEVGISAKRSAFLCWYKDEKKWGIYLLPSDNDFTPIHELGHIFLAKKTNNIYFAQSGKKFNNTCRYILFYSLENFVSFKYNKRELNKCAMNIW